MPRITFLHKDGSRQEVEAEENASLMEVALAHKVIGIEGACGGYMSCTTCHVYIDPDWVSRLYGGNARSDEEEDMLDTTHDVRKTSRLGCQIQITQALDGLVVALPGTKTGWK